VVDGVFIFIFIFIFIKVPVIFWCCVVLCCVTCVDRTFLRVEPSKRRRNLPSFRARGGLPCLPSLPFPSLSLSTCTLHFALAPAKLRLPFPTELISTALNSYSGLSSPCLDINCSPESVQSITICCVCIIWSALSAFARVPPPPPPHCPHSPKRLQAVCILIALVIRFVVGAKRAVQRVQSAQSAAAGVASRCISI